jgi:hypothetical protein
VWVFTRKGSTWTQQGSKLTGAGAETLDSRCVQILEAGEEATMEEILEYCSVNIEFGASVALSANGGTALIGGPGDVYEGGSASRGPHGAAWVFTRSRSTWAQQGGKLAGKGSALFGVHFGSSVALSSDGNIALIGGPLDGWPDSPVGAAWVYARSDSAWIEGEKLKKAEMFEHYERFGNSVSLSSDGDTALIVGASEGARLFTQSDSRWVQQAGTLACGGGAEECQGALSSDASTALVGTAVYVNSAKIPEVNSLSPNGGLEAGGTPVSITGSNLADVKAVKFGSTSATHFVVNSDSSITAVSPPGTGTVDVTVTTTARTSLAWNGDQFSYVPRPAVMTEAADGLTDHSARLRASVNPNGGTPSNGMGISDCHFEYGITTSYGLTVPCDSRHEFAEAEATVQGLTLKTSYHFRIVATNPAGTSYGEDREFTTLPEPPVVVTEAPTGSGSILHATVNPNGASVEDCHFVLVLLAGGFVKRVPCSAMPGSGDTPVAVSAQASAVNLKPGESYFVRIVASNKGGTSEGFYLGPIQFGS